MGDLPDIIGTVSIGIQDGAPALVFSGPEVPGLPGVGTTMILSYESGERRVRVRAGLTAGDDSMTVDLTSLPEEWQRLVGQRPGVRPRTVTLPTPSCDALRSGSGWISYAEYQQRVRMARSPAARPPGRFNPLDPSVLRRAAMAVLYPPLTRAMFEQLVNRCRSLQIFGR
jgi:hypothetical protein